MKNKFIITTTINNPTAAIQKFDQMEDWKLIVIGDKKTPPFPTPNFVIAGSKFG